jgi:hypothetical protein
MAHTTENKGPTKHGELFTIPHCTTLESSEHTFVRTTSHCTEHVTAEATGKNLLTKKKKKQGPDENIHKKNT